MNNNEYLENYAQLFNEINCDHSEYLDISYDNINIPTFFKNLNLTYTSDNGFIIKKTNKLVDKKNIYPKSIKVKTVITKKDIQLTKLDTTKEDLQKLKELHKNIAKIPNLKTNPNLFGKIIPIIFTIIAIICAGLIILTKQVNTYTLLLLSLVASLTIICHCSIGQFCLFNMGKSMWTRNKLGERCNYTKQMYFAALLSGFFVSYLIFVNHVSIYVIKFFKNFLKNYF